MKIVGAIPGLRGCNPRRSGGLLTVRILSESMRAVSWSDPDLYLGDAVVVVGERFGVLGEECDDEIVCVVFDVVDERGDTLAVDCLP